MKVNTNGEGLGLVFPQEYKAILMAWYFEGYKKLEKGSSAAWKYVNSILPPKPNGREAVSRASVINFLQEQVDAGYLDYYEDTGKGGYHKVFRAKMDIDSFWKYVSETVNEKLTPFLKGQA